jgi:hypothetical protein
MMNVIHIIDEWLGKRKIKLADNLGEMLLLKFQLLF